MNSLNKGIFYPDYKTLVHPKHMCNNENMLTELVPYCVEADFGNDARVRVIYKGNVVVSTAWERVELTEVLTVLSLAADLVPVSPACGRGTYLEDNLGSYFEQEGRNLFTAASVNNFRGIELVAP